MTGTFTYIIVMAVVTYLVRVIPLVFFHGEIKSTFLRSFLHYVPYVTLSVMTFPAIISASGNAICGAIGFACAILASLIRGSLPFVATICCLSVYISSLFF